MLVYYNPATNAVRYTVKGFPKNPPSGDYIEVPDDTDVSELAALSVVEGALVEANIQPHVETAVSRVNSDIGDVRALFITEITGQQMIYQTKEAEAKAFLSEVPEPTDLTDYPFLAGEIGSTGDTAAQVAQVYLNLSTQWRQIGAQLEQLRIGTITNLENASTKAEIDQLLSGFNAQIANYT